MRREWTWVPGFVARARARARPRRPSGARSKSGARAQAHRPARCSGKVCPVMHHLPSPWSLHVCLPAGGPHTSTRRSLYSSPSPFSTDFSLMHMHMHIMPSQPACGPKQAPHSRTKARTHERARARTNSRTHTRASLHDDRPLIVLSFNLTALTPVLPRSGWQ